MYFSRCNSLNNGKPPLSTFSNESHIESVEADVLNTFIKQEIFVKEHSTFKDDIKKEVILFKSEHQTSTEDYETSSSTSHQSQFQDGVDDLPGNI